MKPQEHWDQAYRNQGPSQVSWHQEVPELSIRLIAASGVSPSAPLVDVGGGASRLAEHLLLRGFTDVTVLDVSPVGLQFARDRLAALATRVHWIRDDVTTWTPPRRYALWHDRAVFHFLITPEAQQEYADALRRALSPGGHVVLATFGLSGPPRCSGLPVARYSPESLAVALGGGLTLIESMEERHRTPKGGEQQFVYCRFRIPEHPEGGRDTAA